jgi:outer membrane protein TolC
MKILWGVLLPLFAFSQSYGLKTLIDNASSKNGMIEAKKLLVKSAKEGVGAAQSMYLPTVDVGVNGTQVSQANIVTPGKTLTGFALASLNLYDGGRKNALLGEKQFEYTAAVFEKSAFEKSITLEIVRHYYTTQTQKAILVALQERSSELKAQIERVEKFQLAGLSTQEDVYKLQAVYDSNDFTMANTKLQLEKSEQNLRLLSGLPVKDLQKNSFAEPKNVRPETLESIKMLEAKANAIGEASRAIKSGNGPQVNLSNTYRQSKFDDTVNMAGFGGSDLLLDRQNELTLSVGMRLFDGGKISKESEAVRYQKLSLLSEIDYAKKEQRMNFSLSKKSLETTRTQLKSAQSELQAATSTYIVLKQKFEVGLVDNIAFLDALAQKTLAQARYQETIYTYEINKSIYYYYAGKSPREYIR